MKNLTPEHLQCIGGSCPAVYDLTPADLKCGGSNSSCPAVYEITPADLKCGNQPICPGVHVIDGTEDLIVVGKRLDPELEAAMEGKVGPDEYAIRIGRAYFANVPGK